MNSQPDQIVVLQNQEDQDGVIDLKKYWAILKRRWWVIFVTSVVVLSLASVYKARIPKMYEATTVVKIPTSSGGGGLTSALGALLPIMQSNDLAPEIEMIKGRKVAENTLRKLGVNKDESNIGANWDQIVLRFQRSLKVSQNGRTSLVEITAVKRSPKEAKDIANQVADEYIQLSNASRQKVWDNLISSMEAKLKQTRADLERSRQLLYKYEAGEGIPAAYGPLLLGTGSTTREYGGYTLSEASQTIGSLRANIISMEVQLEAMLKTVSDADPRVINLKNQIEANKIKLTQEEQKATEKYNKQFGLTNVAAEVVFNQQLYSSLIAKQEELKAQYIMQSVSPEIVESAIEPLYPISPRSMIISASGAILGIFLGLVLIVIWEYLDKSMHNAENITTNIGIPVLGIIPYLKDKNSKTGVLISDLDANLKNLNSRVNRLCREYYVMLQLEVMASVDKKTEHVDNINNTQDQNGITLLVTSSIPGEGKSLVSANLALSVAQSGKKTVLIDANFHNPSQHKLLNLNPEVGLIELFMKNASQNDVVKNTTLDNLYVVTSGDGNNLSIPPSYLLSSDLEDLIKSLRDRFDVIIFDSSSAASASEAAAIGSKVDGVLLVIKANDTKEDIILLVKQQIQNSGGNILGAVLNCAKVERKYRKYYS